MISDTYENTGHRFSPVRRLFTRPSGKQILKSGTPIGANVEEATGARTKKEFINCMNIAKREARETKYWLRLITGSKIVDDSKAQPLLDEIEVIIKILTSIVKTSENNL